MFELEEVISKIVDVMPEEAWIATLKHHSIKDDGHADARMAVTELLYKFAIAKICDMVLQDIEEHK